MKPTAKVRKLTPAQKDAVVTCYRHGSKSQMQLAVLLNVSQRTIYRVLVERGLIVPTKKDETVAVMELLYKNKISFAQLEKIIDFVNMPAVGGEPSYILQSIRSKKSPKAHIGKQHEILLT